MIDDFGIPEIVACTNCKQNADSWQWIYDDSTMKKYSFCIPCLLKQKDLFDYEETVEDLRERGLIPQ